MYRAIVLTHVTLLSLATAGAGRCQRFLTDRRGDRGQATAEYALVLLGVAAIAALFLAWAGSDNRRIGNLFDKVLRTITGAVG